MRRLILFRHAKAEPRAPGGDDFDRPLAERGRADAALMGRVLAREDLAPDLVLLSPARRTTETWIWAREAFPAAEAELAPDLYNAAAATIAGVVKGAADRADTLMVVGHNPGLHEYAVQLLMANGASAAEVTQVARKFPTASIAAYQIDPAGRASFDGLFLAKDEGGDGEG